MSISFYQLISSTTCTLYLYSRAYLSTVAIRLIMICIHKSVSFNAKITAAAPEFDKDVANNCQGNNRCQCV